MTGNEDRNAGEAIATLAERQHGVVSRRQLLALGLSGDMIDARLASGWLQPVFRGVFAVGHRAIGRRALMVAAVLACGDGAVVSHATAAELLGLRDRQPASIDVTSPGKAGRKLDGIRWHRAGLLAADEAIRPQGIPCTTVARTLVDMSGQYGEKTLRRMVEQAAVLRQLDVEEIDRVLARRRRAPMLRRILAPWRKRTDGQRRDRLRSMAKRRTGPRSRSATTVAGTRSSRRTGTAW